MQEQPSRDAWRANFRKTITAAAQLERAPQLASSRLFRHAVDIRGLTLAKLREWLEGAPLNATGSVHNLTTLAIDEMREAAPLA